ncbi:DUF4384 domain-containing protein [Deinococcus soli (ex Cha et al. 2016)]|uniref:Uncharacterized protein n=2 Tax=Deinococcus soli (ex Cha et al. 2016) TaxID=1309411 RepID=A0ACC6KH98_9DEIO|nr:DUF4384 domain-containing protein [Deinococcus soli (ex Cha et al. 2016)]MDR6218908.1 hypothetical protein [Deinococcus soli (ex Cha et al. 2016)]MDR6328705.1 hypothetical protein [Deinococcus soli (ex Cha et al. 2016)]MDR6751808.1 hypothetical protein [Deinococcus soli (ex Cha et al. 2016)]
MKVSLSAVAALSAALSSAALAQGQLSAQSIIVNPVAADLTVQVNVDKDPGGTLVPTYRPGENVRITARVNQDAYVYLFSLDAAGNVTQLLPNRLHTANFLKANTAVTFPAASAPFAFNVGQDLGLNKVLALASASPLNLSDLSTFRSAQDNFAAVSARGQQGLAQALSIVVNPLPPRSWVTDTAQFTVAAPTPVQTGSLNVRSNVPGATVTLDGMRLGAADQTFSPVRTGTFPLSVTAPGYAPYSGTVTVRAGVTTAVTATLSPLTAPPQPTPSPLDLFTTLIGTWAGLADPARSAFEQKLSALERQGYRLDSRSLLGGRLEATLSKPGSVITLTVTTGPGRTVTVSATERTTYQY